MLAQSIRGTVIPPSSTPKRRWTTATARVGARATRTNAGGGADAGLDCSRENASLRTPMTTPTRVRRRRRGDATTVRFLGKFFRSRDENEQTEEEREDREKTEKLKETSDSFPNETLRGDGDEEEEEEEKKDASEAEGARAVSAAPSAAPLPKTDMKTTLSDLDALLGIDTAAEEAKKREEEERWRASLKPASTDEEVSGSSTWDASVDDANASADAEVGGMSSISPQALEALKKAEAQRKGFSNDKESEIEKVLSELNDIAKKGKEGGDAAKNEELENQFGKLLKILEEPEEPVIAPPDVERIKKEIFGIQTFYVTSVENLGEELNGAGILFKGNLRTERATVWEAVQNGMQTMFNGKYTAFMLEEPLGDDGPSGDLAIDSKYGPRVSFLIVPSDRAGPNPGTSGWQYVLALALMGLTVGSAVQLGLVAEISKLPPETMAWLATAGDVDLPDGALPPGLENFDSVAYVEAALPVTIGVLASSVGHEIGHQIAAAMRKVKLGVPFLIPNGQLGTFGTITQLKSTPETRSDMFDVAAAGPVAGSMVALNLFVYGLSLSIGGDSPELVPIPDSLFNSSLLLGGISHLFLHGSPNGTLVHPYFIAGWCALTTQALNLLPVGSIDGGRIAQSAFGRRVLGATSLGTYIGLTFGVIASTLSLPWAIYIVLTQRTPEYAPKDDVTEVDDGRAQLAFALIAVAFLILLPGPVDPGTSAEILPPF